MAVDRGRVLVIHFGALGDFVLSFHALGRLAAWAGRENLVVAARGELGELVVGSQQLVALEGEMISGAMSPEPPQKVLNWLGEFGLVVVFSSGPRPELARNTMRAGAGLWQLPTRPPEGMHLVQAQLKVLEEKGLTQPAPPLRPHISQPLPPPCPVVAPGSGGRPKRLEPELAGKIIEELSSQGKVKLVFGPAEEPAYRNAVLAACNTKPIVVAEPTLRDLVHVLAGASPYLGADSGVTHLAAVLGVPTVAVFKASDPRAWGPIGENVEVLSLRELTSFRVH